MASTDKPDPESVVKSEAGAPCPPPTRVNYVGLDVALRVLLFAASLTAVVVMVTAKQTELVTATLPGVPNPVTVPKEAKFSDSPAFIYFVAALSVAGLYSIISTLASLSIIQKPEYATNFLLYFVFFDLIFLGIVASATGTAGGVSYIGLKGNSHVQWNKVCNVYDKFCRHIGASIFVSLFASIVLVLLTMLSVCSIYAKIPK